MQARFLDETYRCAFMLAAGWRYTDRWVTVRHQHTRSGLARYPEVIPPAIS